MKRITKLVAAASSVMMLSSMAVFAAPAVNAAYEEEEAKSYIVSMEDEETQKVAQYFWNEGFSLEELKATMQRYCSGKAMYEAELAEESATPMTASASVEDKYYSSKTVSKFTHYLIFITDNVNQQLDYYFRVQEDLNDTDLFDDAPTPGSVFTLNTSKATTNSSYTTSTLKFTNNSTTNVTTIRYSTSAFPSISNEWIEFMRIPLVIGDYAYDNELSENGLYNSILIKYGYDFMSADHDIIVKCDINHDGRADDVDAYVLQNHIVNGTDLLPSNAKAWSYNYTFHAADADHNGVLNSNDVKVYNQYLAGLIQPW